jgi:hypothetical protein
MQRKATPELCLLRLQFGRHGGRGVPRRVPCLSVRHSCRSARALPDPDTTTFFTVKCLVESPWPGLLSQPATATLSALTGRT